MLERVFNLVWFIVKMCFRFSIALWITNNLIYPESLGDLVFAFYFCYVLGKWICGGYRKKLVKNKQAE